MNKAPPGVKPGTQEYNAWQYALRPEESKAHAMKWRKENPEAYRKYQREYRAKWLKENPEKNLVIQVKYYTKKSVNNPDTKYYANMARHLTKKLNELLQSKEQND